jgi:hypothetical protein
MAVGSPTRLNPVIIWNPLQSLPEGAMKAGDRYSSRIAVD